MLPALYLHQICLDRTLLWKATCPSPLSIHCDRSPYCGRRHFFDLSRFSVIEAIIVARDKSFTSHDSLWSKRSLWPETCPSPLSILFDRSNHCGQRHVLHLYRFSVNETRIVARDMSFTSLDFQWSTQSLCPETCPSHLSISVIAAIIVARDMSLTSLNSLWSKPKCGQRYVLYHSRFSLIKPPFWPETYPSPLSILFDRNLHGEQRHVLHLSRFSVIEAILVARDMSFTTLDSLW